MSFMNKQLESWVSVHIQVNLLGLLKKLNVAITHCLCQFSSKFSNTSGQSYSYCVYLPTSN